MNCKHLFTALIVGPLTSLAISHAGTVNIDFNNGMSATEATDGGFCESANSTWNGVNGTDYTESNLLAADGTPTGVSISVSATSGREVSAGTGGEMYGDGLASELIEIQVSGLRAFQRYRLVIYQMADGEGLVLLPRPFQVDDLPRPDIDAPCALDRYDPFSEDGTWIRREIESFSFGCELVEDSTAPADLPGTEDRDFVVCYEPYTDADGNLNFSIAGSLGDAEARLAGLQVCGALMEDVGAYQPDIFLRGRDREGLALFESRAFVQELDQRMRKRTDQRTLQFAIKNQGSSPDIVRLKAQDQVLNRRFRPRYVVNGANVTGAVRTGNARLALGPNAQAGLNVRYIPQRRILRADRVEVRARILAHSTNDPSSRDMVEIDLAAGRYPTEFLERFCKPLDEIADVFD